MVGPLAHEQHLIEAERLDQSDALGVIIDQCLAVTKKGVVDGVPVAAQFLGDLLDAAPVLADLLGQPTTGPVGHEQARERNASINLAPTGPGTIRIGTEEPSFVPDDPRRPPVHRQVHQRDPVAVLHPRHHPTLGTAHDLATALEVNRDRLAVCSLNALDVDVEQVDEDLAHACRVCFHGGLFQSAGLELPTELQSPRLSLDPRHYNASTLGPHRYPKSRVSGGFLRSNTARELHSVTDLKAEEVQVHRLHIRGDHNQAAAPAAERSGRFDAHLAGVAEEQIRNQDHQAYQAHG